jgi:hypothetical protein
MFFLEGGDFRFGGSGTAVPVLESSCSYTLCFGCEG